MMRHDPCSLLRVDRAVHSAVSAARGQCLSMFRGCALPDNSDDRVRVGDHLVV